MNCLLEYPHEIFASELLNFDEDQFARARNAIDYSSSLSLRSEKSIHGESNTDRVLLWASNIRSAKGHKLKHTVLSGSYEAYFLFWPGRGRRNVIYSPNRAKWSSS